MRIVTWNVNGIRSVLSKSKTGEKHKGTLPENVVRTLLDELKPDVLCLQEIKCSTGIDIQAMLDLQNIGYEYCIMNCATVRKGYSGTCIISKTKPISTVLGFGTFAPDDVLNNEGRVVTVELDRLYVVNVYTPNSKPDLSRLGFRTEVWDKTFREWVTFLSSKKRVIVCGDLNVAPFDIDVNNPTSAKGSHGFTKEEQNAFQLLLKEAQLVDSFREMNPNIQAFSWFSPFAKSRERNKGWRIDHILVSKRMKDKIQSAKIHLDYFGSDHVPCSIDINI